MDLCLQAAIEFVCMAPFKNIQRIKLNQLFFI